MNNDIFQKPYKLSKEQKQSFLLDHLKLLQGFHVNNCEGYGNMMHSAFSKKNFDHLSNIPFLPVQLFKMLDLYSVSKEDIVKTLMSSGTTSQLVSKIYIDRETSTLQTKALTSIVTSFIGKLRMPMIIVDTPNVIRDRKKFSARGAGIVGFSNFGRDHFYLFDDQMNINWDGLFNFLDKYKTENVLLFGFTFVIWQYLYLVCKQKGISLDLQNGILVHGGGWKKLKEHSVSNEQFKQALFEQFGMKSIHNYYGMVEQVGSVYMECSCGFFHTPDFADIVIRDVDTFKVVEKGNTGIIQSISILPKSYPGHSLLTEDIGVLIGEDDCSCGRKGKYFKVEGRLPKAELRGCSDTLAYGGVLKQ